MTGARGLPSKRDVARALLLKGTVFVHLDPRDDGVLVPQWLKHQPQLVLQVGLDMHPVPIPDLRVDDVGVYGTLSFNRTAFTCAVPWASVFAVVGDDGRGMVWPNSMPSEIAAEVEREVHRARAPAHDEGAIDELHVPARKRIRQVAARADKPKPPPTGNRRKRPTPPAASLELIAGDGDSRRTSSQRPQRQGERRFPSYLRVVK